MDNRARLIDRNGKLIQSPGRTLARRNDNLLTSATRVPVESVLRAFRDGRDGSETITVRESNARGQVRELIENREWASIQYLFDSMETRQIVLEELEKPVLDGKIENGEILARVARNSKKGDAIAAVQKLGAMARSHYNTAPFLEGIAKNAKSEEVALLAADIVSYVSPGRLAIIKEESRWKSVKKRIWNIEREMKNPDSKWHGYRREFWGQQ